MHWGDTCFVICACAQRYEMCPFNMYILSGLPQTINQQLSIHLLVDCLYVQQQQQSLIVLLLHTMRHQRVQQCRYHSITALSCHDSHNNWLLYGHKQYALVVICAMASTLTEVAHYTWVSCFVTWSMAWHAAACCRGNSALCSVSSVSIESSLFYRENRATLYNNNHTLYNNNNSTNLSFTPITVIELPSTRV